MRWNRRLVVSKRKKGKKGSLRGGFHSAESVGVLGEATPFCRVGIGGTPLSS